MLDVNFTLIPQSVIGEKKEIPMLKIKFLSEGEKKAFKRWFKAFFTRKHVCPFCRVIFNTPRVKKLKKSYGRA